MTEPPVRAPAAFRCAIYTRKSTEEGLEQEFNSLDAQREACESFVASQRGEGWELLPDRYDDGGYSGGNTERPALKRLMADVESGRVNVVVVYKLDRLSRSLLDFTKLMEVFDARKVAFVSITQKFDTSTSMGRLMLHILLSFAQFEREMIAERTRDKMSAARRKGKWVGGTLVLGYDVDPERKRLVVNEDEAARVREIFDIYLKEPSLVGLAQTLNGRGWTTKSWTTKTGDAHAGTRWDKMNLQRLLTNVLYTGRVSHHGTVYPGEHPPIVERAAWDRAQQFLRHNGRTGGATVKNKHGALLRGVARCVPCDSMMVHTWTLKGTKRYRYYTCLRAQKQGWASCPTKAVPAAEIERFVVDRIRVIGRDPGVLAATADEARRQHAARVEGLERDRGDAERELRTLHGQVRKLAGATEESATARLADLQERTRTAERRLTDVREGLAAAERERVDDGDLAAALSLFDPVWDSLYPREQARVLRLLVERVGYDGREGTLAITFRPTGIRALADEVAAGRKEARR
ncbi:MAG: recombinase family protein [Planctomycetes bacterium]|nr:recombinase family protein [Planctomycetota bacterium]